MRKVTTAITPIISMMLKDKSRVGRTFNNLKPLLGGHQRKLTLMMSHSDDLNPL